MINLMFKTCLNISFYITNNKPLKQSTYLFIKEEKGEKKKLAGSRWLTPVILPTQEAEIIKIMVQSKPLQIVLKTLS
jgi:hypothetical protein